MSTPDPASTTPTQPAINTGLTTAIVALLVDLFTYFGMPVDGTTKMIITLAVTALGPVVAGLIIKAKVWCPASVLALRDDLLDLVRAAQATNPPAVVTNEPMSAVQAAEAHPGVLGLSEGGTGPIPRHGRHES